MIPGIALTLFALTAVAVTKPSAVNEGGERWPRSDTTAEEIIGKLRDELLHREVSYSLRGAKVLIEAWRRYDNTIRLHSALGDVPPAPETLGLPGRPPAMAPETMMHQPDAQTVQGGAGQSYAARPLGLICEIARFIFSGLKSARIHF